MKGRNLDWDTFIGELADLCQRSDMLPWREMLYQALQLFTDAVGAGRAALLLTDTHHAPVYGIGYPNEAGDSWCASLEKEHYRINQQLDPLVGLQKVFLSETESCWVLPIPPQGRNYAALMAFADPEHLPKRERLEWGSALLTPLVQLAYRRWQQAQREIIAAASRATPHRRVLKEVLRALTEASGLEDAALLLQQGEQLEVVVATGTLSELEESRYALADTCYLQLQQGRASTCASANELQCRTLLPEATRCAAFPLFHEGERVGMVILSTSRPGAGLDVSTPVLEPLLNALPPLLQSHQLADERRIWMDRYHILSHTIQRLSTFTTVPEMLQKLGDIALGVMDADRMAILPIEKYRLQQQYRNGNGGSYLDFISTLYQRSPELFNSAPGRPLHFPNAWQGAPDLAAIARREAFHTVLVLPLHVLNRPLGVVALYRNQIHPFSEDEISLGRTLAGQIALTLSNADLFRQEQEQRDLARALAQATAALTQSLDLDLVMEQILEQVGNVVSHDAGNVMLIEEGEARIARARGYEKFGLEEWDVESRRFSLELPSLRRMVDTRSPILISDTTASAEWIVNPGFEWLKSYAAAPIVLEDQVFGFINVDSQTPSFFSLKDAQRLKSFADYAGIALQNAHLYQQSQQHVEEMALLYEIASLLSSAREFAGAASQVLEKIYAALRVDAVWLVPSAVDDQSALPVACIGITEDAVVDLVAGIEFCPAGSSINQFTHLDEDESSRYDGLRTYLPLPLCSGYRVQGLLYLGWRRAVSHDDFSYPGLLETLSTQIGTGLERAHLLEELQERRRYLEGLNTVVGMINRATELKDVLATGLVEALHVAGAAAGEIYLWDLVAQKLTLRAVLIPGEDEESYTPPQAFTPPEGLPGRAFERREVLVEEPPEEPSAAFATSIGLPLIVDGQAVGVLHLHFERRYALSEQTRELLGAISDQLALAVQQGLLTAQMREQLKTLHDLYETSAAFLSQMGTGEIIFILLRTLNDLIDGAVGSFFYRLTPDGWQRMRIYAPSDAHDLRAHWREGEVPEDEVHFLNACHQERMLVIVGEKRGRLPRFWDAVESVGARQQLYFPLTLPNRDFFGVVSILLNEERPLAPHESALAWAVIQQGTAALARVRLYEASQQNESRLRAILESSQDGIILVGNELNLRYVNGQALRQLNVAGTPTTWEGHSLAEAIAAFREEIPSLARWLTHLARYIWEQEDVSGEPPSVFESRSGLLLKLEYRPVYLGHNRLLGALFLLRDVTEQRAMERMRDDLLHMLVHDIRNPLSLIHNALQLLKDPLMWNESDELIEMALNNTERGLRMVNAILDIGKLETGRFELYQEAMVLSQQLERTVRTVVVPHDMVTWEIDVPDDLPPLWVDVTVTTRILENILSNALKFVPEESGLIRISAVHDAGWIEVRIYNNGPPISPDVHKRLFQKFATGEYQKRGYGLGLAFCRLAVEAHGGKIWAENEPSGVTFHFTLPLISIAEVKEEE